MQIEQRSYPHPVLSYFTDDIVDCSFHVEVKPSVTQNSYHFEIAAKTSYNDLIEKINSGQAMYSLHVECPSSRYRRLFNSFDAVFNVDIPSEFLDGRVQICAFILATADFDNYVSDNFHPD